MDQVDPIKSAAFISHTEWGPDSRIPREERLAELFPQISEAERQQWLLDFQAVEIMMYRLADEGEAMGMSNEEFTEFLRKEHPFLTDEAGARAHWLAGYSQWHG